jgi:anoctamin-10/anoctamin-7
MAFIAPWLSPSPEQPIGYQGQCGYYNCMGPLSINLAIIYGSRLTSNNILEALLDWYYYYCKWSTETSDISSDRYVSPPETEYFLLEMDTMNASIELFADSAIQFGFSILFITALPVSLLATLVSNYIRVKICTWKIMYWYQRPIPRGGQDIGTWKYIFFIICFIGVITNGALICFTMDTLKKESETNESLMSDVSKPDDYDHAELNLVGRMGVWFGFMFAILGIQLVLCWAIPSVPEIVNIQIGRMDFIVSKIIEHEEDDDYDDDNDALQFLGDVQDDNDIEESGPCCSCFGSGNENRTNKVKNKSKKLPAFPIFHAPNSKETIREPLKKRKKK